MRRDDFRDLDAFLLSLDHPGPGDLVLDDWLHQLTTVGSDSAA
jgi:hypothetical protein